MSTIKTGTVLPAAAKVSPLLIVGEVAELIRAVAVTAAEEATKRHAISADLERDLHRIAVTGQALLTYIDRAHDERAIVFGRYFDALDVAVASGDVAMSAAILDGIVRLTDKGPFSELADIVAVEVKLADPHAQWDL